MGKEIDLLLLLKKLHDDRPARASSSVLISKLASQAETITISDSSVSASTTLYPARWNGTDARWNEFQWWDNKVLDLPLYGLATSPFTSLDAFTSVCTAAGAVAGASGWTFDGVDDRITVPDANILDVARLTINAVVYLQAHSTANGEGIVCKGPLGGAHGPYQLFFAGGVASPQLSMRINAGGGAEVSGSNLSLDTWYFLSGMYDEQNISIWVNGTQQTSVSYTGAISVTTDSLFLGPYYAANRPLSGIISDVRIYNRALSTSEISSAYTDAKARMPWLP